MGAGTAGTQEGGGTGAAALDEMMGTVGVATTDTSDTMRRTRGETRTTSQDTAIGSLHEDRSGITRRR